jgi:CRP-like cAMP-binding protein
VQLTELLPGTVFGEIALFTGTMIRSASVHTENGAMVP